MSPALAVHDPITKTPPPKPLHALEMGRHPMCKVRACRGLHRDAGSLFSPRLHREVPVVLSPSSLPQPRPVVCKADIPGSAFAAEPAIMAQLVCIRAIAAQSRKRASYVVASAAAELTSDERRSLPAWVQRSADSAPQFVRRSVKSSEDNQLHQLAASHHLELTSGDLAAEDLVLGYGGRPASFDAAGHRGGGQMEGCRVWSRHGCSSSRRSSILGRSSRLS